METTVNRMEKYSDDQIENFVEKILMNGLGENGLDEMMNGLDEIINGLDEMINGLLLMNHK